MLRSFFVLNYTPYNKHLLVYENLYCYMKYRDINISSGNSQILLSLRGGNPSVQPQRRKTALDIIITGVSPVWSCGHVEKLPSVFEQEKLLPLIWSSGKEPPLEGDFEIWKCPTVIGKQRMREVTRLLKLLHLNWTDIFLKWTSLADCGRVWTEAPSTRWLTSFCGHPAFPSRPCCKPIL